MQITKDKVAQIHYTLTDNKGTVLDSSSRREPRTFYVKIDEPGPGAELGPRTLMQVAIVPPGYPAARDTTALNLDAP